MPGLYFPITADSSQFNSEVNKAKATVRQMAREIEGEGKSIESVFSRMQNAAQAALAGFGLGGFVRQMVEVRSEFQKTEIAFKTMLDSEEKASSLMNQLINTAAVTPFGVSDITESAKQLLAYNTAAEEVNDTIIKLGDIAAGMSMPIKDLVFLYGTTIAKGKMDTMDLRQFLNRGIPIAQELAKVMGLDVNNAINEVGEAIKKGAVNADIFQKAIMNLASTKFGGLMEAQSKTFAGQISNIEDQIEQMFNEMGKASEGAVNEALEGVTFLVDHWREVGKVILTVVSAYGTYKAAAIAVAAVEKAKQNVTAAEINKSLDNEIAQLKAQLVAKNEVRQASIEEMLASKELSSAQAEEIAGKQALIEKLRTELALRQEASTTKIVSASSGAADEVSEQQALADAYRERADAIADMAQSAEENISSQDAQTVAEQAQTLATEASAAATEMETVAQTANTLQTNANTAADEANTVATNVNTLSTEEQIIAFRAATAAQGGFSMAKLADAAKTKVATVAQRLYQGAVIATTNAMNSMKVAFMTNPVGLIIGALTTAIGLFYTFNDELDESAEVSKKFGDACSKASSDANTLYAVINSSPKGSKVYKDALKELTNTAREYGVTIDEEGDKLIQLNKVRDEVIAKINEEAAAREHANGIQSATDTYNTSFEESFSDFRDAFSDLGINTAFADAFKNVIPQDAIDRMVEYRRELELIEKSEMSQAEKIHAKNKVLRDISATYSDVYGRLKEYLEAAGVEEEQIKKLLTPTGKLVDSLTDGKRVYQDTTNAVNKAAEAYAKVSAQTSLAALEQDDIANNFGFASEMANKVGKSVQDLTTDIAGLMGNYSDNFIQFTIGLTAQVDESTMQLLNSLGLQDLGKFAKQAMANATKLRDLQKQAAEQNKRIRYLIKDRQGIARDADWWARTSGAATSVVNSKTETPKATPKETPKKTNKKTGKSDVQKQAEEEAKERQKAFELQRRQEEEQAEQLQAARDAQEKALIAQMKNAGARERAQAEFEHKKALDEIDEQEREYRKKNYEAAKEKWELENKDKTKVYSDTNEGKKYDEVALTKEQLAEITALREEENAKWSQIEDERIRTEIQSMRDYLSEYGTIQQQRLAIAQEYAEKIADAQAIGNKGEEKRLIRERDNRLSEVNAKNLAMSIDWGAAFKGVGNVLGDIARETLQKVEEYMKTAEFKGLDAANKKSYIDLRNRLREETGAGATSPFNFKIWGQIEEQVNEYKDKVRQLNVAQNAHTQAVNELEKAQERLKKAVDEREKMEAGAALAVAQFKVDVTGKKQTEAEGEVQQSQDNLTNSTNAAAQGIDNFSSYLNEMKSGSLYGFANGITKLITSLRGGAEGVGKSLGELGGKIGGLIGAILQIIDALGDDPAGFIGGLLDNIGDVVEKVLADLPKLVGNIIGGVVGIVKGIFAGIGSWFSHGTENQVARTTERLTESNNALRTSIDKLTNEFEKQAGGEAIKQYQKALANQEAYNKNQQDILQAQMGKYGKHRSNAYYLSGELSSADYKAISNAIKKNITNLQGLFNLSPEDIDKIRTELPALWTRIISAGKYDDVKDYWEAYADEAGKTKELTDLINENLTQISFESMYSSFEDTLMDMGTSAAEWGNKFSEMLQKSLLHFALGDEFQDKMNNWYQTWADTMKRQNGKLTEDQIALYREEWDAFLQEGLEKRNAIAELTGYTGSDSEGSGAYKAAQSFSQEQGDELNGRLTAIQIGQQYQNEQLANAVMTLQSMSVVGQEQGNTLAEMRNLMLIGNSHLEDIARYTRIAAQYGDAIETIADKIKTL